MASSASHDWLEPTEKWPDHTNTHLSEALAFAQERGWWFRASSGHGFGTLKCRHPAPMGDACRAVVSATPKDPWARARDLKREVRHCPHEAARSQISKAFGLVEKAENLCQAVAALIEHEDYLNRAGEKYARAEELIDELEADTASITELLEKAGELEQFAAAAQAEAESLDVDIQKGDSASSVFGDAEQAASLARQEVLSLDVSQAKKRLKQRLSVVKAQLTELRNRLSER